MDSQGFTSPAALERAALPHAMPHAPSPLKQPKKYEPEVETALRGRDGKAAVGGSTAAQGLRSANGLLMQPVQLEGLSVMGSMVLGGMGFKRLTAGLATVFASPAEALRNTGIARLFHVPAVWLGKVSEHAAQIGGRARPVSQAALRGSEALERGATTVDHAVGRMAGQMGKPLGSALDGFEKTVPGGVIHRGMERAVQWRATAAISNHTKALDTIESALRGEAGFFGRAIGKVTNLFKKTTIVPGEVLPELSHLGGQIRAAGRNAEQIRGVASDLQRQMAAGAFEKEALGRVSNVITKLSKLARHAQTAEHLEGAIASGGLKHMLGASAKLMGHVPILGVILGAAVALGAGATLVTARATHKTTQNTRQQLLDALPSSLRESELMRGVDAMGVRGERKLLGNTSMQLVGNAANDMFWINPHGGGVALGAAQLLPMITGQAPSENPALDAWGALHQHDAGKIQLKQAQRVECVKTFLAALPAIAAHHGVYNKLVGPTSEAMVNQHMDAQAIARLAADTPQFNLFATKVQSEQKPAQPAAITTAVTNNPSVTHGVTKSASVTDRDAANPLASAAAEAKYMASERPTLRVAANDSTAQGTVVAHQRAVG